MYEFEKMFERSKWFTFGYWSLSVIIVTVIVLFACSVVSIMSDVGHWVRGMLGL